MFALRFGVRTIYLLLGRHTTTASAVEFAWAACLPPQIPAAPWPHCSCTAAPHAVEEEQVPLAPLLLQGRVGAQRAHAPVVKLPPLPRGTRGRRGGWLPRLPLPIKLPIDLLLRLLQLRLLLPLHLLLSLRLRAHARVRVFVCTFEWACSMCNVMVCKCECVCACVRACVCVCMGVCVCVQCAM